MCREEEGDPIMSLENTGSAPDDPEVHRDRREHGGASGHPDDDALAARTEQERVEAGLDAYDPADVPAATDEAPVVDPTDDEAYREEGAEVKREEAEGELYPLTDKHPFPPTRYDRS
jgi:hypothetical protein